MQEVSSEWTSTSQISLTHLCRRIVAPDVAVQQKGENHTCPLPFSLAPQKSRRQDGELVHRRAKSPAEDQRMQVRQDRFPFRIIRIGQRGQRGRWRKESMLRINAVVL